MKLLAIASALGALATGCAPAVELEVKTTEASSDLTRITDSTGDETHPAISPDARELAYAITPARGAASHVEVVRLDDGARGAPRVVFSSGETTAIEPTWMPDGSGLLFVSQTPRAFYSLMQTIGPSAARTAFVSEAADPFLSGERPAMSPDGKTVAMSLVNARTFESGWHATKRFDRAIAFSDLIGTGTTMLGAGTDPAFSPDGRRIAFSRAVDGRGHLFVQPLDGSDAVQITTGPSDDVEPSWSPDGDAIAFCSIARDESGFAHANLFVVAPDGSGLVQMTEGDRMSCHPSWGRDGFVYFHSNAGGRFHVWRLRARR
jgi:Tol biopolymer transport system component